MTSDAKTVEEYLSTLPEDRLAMVNALRKVMLENLQPGFEEGMQYGGIGYYVPHSVYPNGYHCDPKQPLPFVGILSQKQHVGWYAFCLYSDPELIESFTEAYKATGKRVDMGKSCVRFKKFDDMPLELIGQTVRNISVDKFVGAYEESLAQAKLHRKK